MKRVLGPAIGLILLGTLGWQCHELRALRTEATELQDLLLDLEGRLADDPSAPASGPSSSAPPAKPASAPGEPLTPKGSRAQPVPTERSPGDEARAASEEALDAAVERVLERRSAAQQDESIEQQVERELGKLMLRLDTLEEEGGLAEDEARAVENLLRDFFVAFEEVRTEQEGDWEKIGYEVGLLEQALEEDVSRVLGAQRGERVLERLKESD